MRISPKFGQLVRASGTITGNLAPPRRIATRRLQPTNTLCLLVLLVLPLTHAQDATTPSGTPAPEDQELRKVNGIFDTDLPKTEKKGRIRLLVHPHLGDFTRRGYVRVPVGVRVGVNDHVEFTATVEPYFQHYLRSGSSGNGIGDVEFGGKYSFVRWLKPEYAASTGINVRLPVGTPPLDMTDGYNHYAPYFVMAGKAR